MAVKVRYAPEATADLAAIYDFIAPRGGPGRALSFVDRIKAACDRLADFPERGKRRDDLRSGLRIMGYDRRVAIAFHIEQNTVTIDRVLYAGRDIKLVFDQS